MFRKNSNFLKFFIVIILAVLSLTVSFSAVEFINAKTNTTIKLYTGDSKRLVPKKSVSNYKIKIKDKTIVKVTKKGNLKAKRKGITTVTVKNKLTKKKIKYKVIVEKKKLKSLKVSVKAQKHWTLGKYKIKITKTPKKDKEQIYWTSSNYKIAEVINNKVVTKSSGRVKITAYTKESNLSSSFWMTIYDSPKIKFKDTAPVVIENKTSKTLSLETNKYPLSFISFSSNHPDVISVNKKGKVTAIRPSNAVITAKTLDGKKAKIKVIAKSDKGLVTQKILKDYNAKKYDNVMIVAHPDDETLWGGANLYNESYFVVCLTDGFRLVRANDYRKILKFTHNGGIILNYPDDQDRVRDDWTYVRAGMRKDIKMILEYKNWKKVVTYNPEGVTGHMHHKMNYQDVYDLSLSTNNYDKLYYFNRFFKKGQIPENEPRISDRDLNIKYQEINLYTSVRKNIDNFWVHMLPYERFILAKNWYHEYPNIGNNASINYLTLPTAQIGIKGAELNNRVVMLENSVQIELYKDEVNPVETIPYDLDSEIDVSGLGVGYHELPLSVNPKYNLNNDVKIKINIIEDNH